MTLSWTAKLQEKCGFRKVDYQHIVNLLIIIWAEKIN